MGEGGKKVTGRKTGRREDGDGEREKMGKEMKRGRKEEEKGKQGNGEEKMEK